MNADLIRRTDRALGAHPQFADPAAITARAVARARLGLAMLARRHPDTAGPLEVLAGRADAELRAVLMDPVLGNAFEDDMTRLERGVGGPSSTAYYLRAAGPNSGGAGPSERLAGHPRRPWPEQGPAWLLGDPARAGDGPVANRLRQLYAQSLPAESMRQVPVTEHLHAAIGEAAGLLTALLPTAGAGVLPHIGLVGFVRDDRPDEQLYSMSAGDGLPGAILFGPDQLRDPWVTAELLLHEGLHLKLFDVARSGALAADPDRQVPIPWRTGSWTLVRVVFALHVYVHLMLFRAAAVGADPELRARYGDPPADDVVYAPSPGSPAARDRTHLTVTDRAEYLAYQALAAHADGLTAAGRRFAWWLVDTITPLAPWTRRRMVTPAPAASPVPPLAGGYRRVEPALRCALPELGQLLVMPDRAPRVHWLNARAWQLYALCDGRDTAAIERAYRTSLAGTTPNVEATAQLRHGLAGLVGSGLLSTTTPAA